MNRNFLIIFIAILLLGVAGIVAMYWLTEKPHRMNKQDQRAANLLARGETAQAMAIWEGLLQQKPEDINLLNRLGIACTKTEDYARAESLFHRAMELDPTEPQAYFNLALLRMRQDRMDQAEAMFLELMKVADWYPEGNYHLGYIYEKRGQLALAVDYYVRELNVNGACAKAWRRYLALKDQVPAQRPPRPHKPLPTADG